MFLLEKIDSANGLSSSTGSFDITYFKSEGVDVSASKILAILKLHGSKNLYEPFSEVVVTSPFWCSQE